MTQRTIKQKSLVDLLKLDTLNFTTGGCHPIKEIVENVLEKGYECSHFGYFERFEDVESYRRTFFDGLFWIDNFNKHFFSDNHRKLTIEEEVKKTNFVRECFQKSTLEELDKLSIKVSEIVERDNPITYYKTMTGIYYELMNNTGKFSDSMFLLKEKVKPLLESNNNCLSIKELIPIGGKGGIFDALNNLPTQQRSEIYERHTLRTSDLDELSDLLIKIDGKRNQLHKKIFSYGKQHFEKDYLDVFIDIMSHERLPTERWTTFYPVEHKKGALVLDIGFIQIPSSGFEFSRRYGQKIRWLIEDDVFKPAYEKLKKFRKQNNEYYNPLKYKSDIAENRTEDDDDKLLKKVEEKYPEYIAFRGDYLFSSMHGSYIFRKLLEVNVNEIRKREKLPENKITKIKDYFISILPKKDNCYLI